MYEMLWDLTRPKLDVRLWESFSKGDFVVKQFGAHKNTPRDVCTADNNSLRLS